MNEKELVEFIAKSLVDNPDKVQINVVESEKSTILELSVDEPDIGKIIGKHGRIAKAVRIILSAVSNKSNKRVLLDIMD
ncbi:MAG TPA: KH domain-containing protein [Spirochaetota bacterium]|nr:KH domain-containing protein [Spirochaetota bacterium]